MRPASRSASTAPESLPLCIATRHPLSLDPGLSQLHRIRSAQYRLVNDPEAGWGLRFDLMLGASERDDDVTVEGPQRRSAA